MEATQLEDSRRNNVIFKIYDKKTLQEEINLEVKLFQFEIR